MFLLKYPKWWFPFRILTVPFENYEKPRMWMLFTWALPNIKTCAPGPTSTVATATNAPRENTSPRYTKGKLPSSRCRFESVAMHVSSFDITSILFHEFFQKALFWGQAKIFPMSTCKLFAKLAVQAFWGELRWWNHMLISTFPNVHSIFIPQMWNILVVYAIDVSWLLGKHINQHDPAFHVHLFTWCANIFNVQQLQIHHYV